MKVKNRSLAVLVLITALLLIAMSCASGCVNHLEDEVVIGDFVCQEWSDGTIHLKNLSEEGKKKKYIVVPEELDGRKVVMLGYRNAVFSTGKSNWQSKNLEKVFICGEYIDFKHGLFEECPNLNKVLILNNISEQLEGYGENISVFSSIISYSKRTEHQNNILWEYSKIYVSNVSYYYNYQDSPNDGLYWIDDVEDGELIDFIPENPEREGYIFEGWYKEQECINKWDFEKDRVVKAQIHLEGVERFIENKLFAKWIKE